MNKLLIVARDGKYIVKCNNNVVERQYITDVLNDTFFNEQLSDAVELISTIFTTANAEAFAVFGEGNIWLAQVVARGEKTSGTGDSAYSALASLFIAVTYNYLTH